MQPARVSAVAAVLFMIIEDVAEEGNAVIEPGKRDQNKTLGFDRSVHGRLSGDLAPNLDFQLNCFVRLISYYYLFIILSDKT